jgi:hypothetical protein
MLGLIGQCQNGYIFFTKQVSRDILPKLPLKAGKFVPRNEGRSNLTRGRTGRCVPGKSPVPEGKRAADG